MKNLLKIVGIGMVAVTLIASTNVPVYSAEDKLAISIWGGSYAERFKEHVVKGFEAKYNVKVVVEGGRSSERLSKLIATKGRGIDLFYITDNQMLEAKQRGILQPVNVNNIPNMNQLYDFARDPLGDSTGPAFTILGVGLAYNKDHFSTAPNSWTHLKRQDLKARVGYPDMGVSYGPMMLILMAEMNGGNIDNVDPGFETLQKMKDRLQFFKRSGPVLKSINQGDVSIAPCLNIFARKDPSAPMRFTWPKEGGMGVLNMVCVVKGTKNAALAEKFINYHLSVPVQEAMLRKQGETPVNVKVDALEDLPFTVLEKSDISKVHFWDLVKISNHRANWISRWQEEVVAK